MDLRIGDGSDWAFINGAWSEDAQGRIAGMVLLSITSEPKALEWTRAWIETVARGR